MDIIIQSLGFRASEQLDEYTRTRLAELKSGNIVSATVTLFKASTSAPEKDYCEMLLSEKGHEYFVKKHDDHFEKAISACVEVLSQQIQEAKKKSMDRRKGDAAQIQDAITDAEVEFDGDVELEDVVKQ